MQLKHDKQFLGNATDAGKTEMQKRGDFWNNEAWKKNYKKRNYFIFKNNFYNENAKKKEYKKL